MIICKRSIHFSYMFPYFLCDLSCFYGEMYYLNYYPLSVQYNMLRPEHVAHSAGSIGLCSARSHAPAFPHSLITLYCLGLKWPKVAQAVIKTAVFVRIAAHLARFWGKSRTSDKRTAGYLNVLWKLLHCAMANR